MTAQARFYSETSLHLKHDSLTYLHTFYVQRFSIYFYNNANFNDEPGSQLS